MSYRRGDVVWSDDPFKDDPDAGRPWLVLNTDAHPFADEQYVAVALSTSGHDGGFETTSGSKVAFLEGATPCRGPSTPHSWRSWSTARDS